MDLSKKKKKISSSDETDLQTQKLQWISERNVITACPFRMRMSFYPFFFGGRSITQNVYIQLVLHASCVLCVYTASSAEHSARGLAFHLNSRRIVLDLIAQSAAALNSEMTHFFIASNRNQLPLLSSRFILFFLPAQTTFLTSSCLNKQEYDGTYSQMKIKKRDKRI